MQNRVALYARVSTNDQHAENQMIELRTTARLAAGQSRPNTSIKASAAAPRAARSSMA